MQLTNMLVLKRKNGKPSAYKFIKLLLVLVLSLYLMKYVYVAIAKYDRNLVGTNTRIESKSSFKFPTVSFCQKVSANDTQETFSITEAKHWMNLSNNEGFSFVNVTPTNKDEVSPDLKININGLWEQYSELFWAIPYYCISYMPPHNSRTEFQGLGSVLTIKLWSEKSLETLFMFLSHPKLLRTRNLFGTTVSMINSPTDMHIKYFVFSLKFKKKIKLPQKQHTGISYNSEAQCSDQVYKEEINTTMEKCMKNYMNARFPCYKDANNKSRSCSAKEKNYISKIQGIGEAEFVKLSGCLFPCTTHTYDTNLVNTVIAPRNEENSRYNVVVMIYISEASMEVNEEFLVYDDESLMGDVGGMVGMLMGVSILAIYETVYKFIRKVVRKGVRVTV